MRGWVREVVVPWPVCGEPLFFSGVLFGAVRLIFVIRIVISCSFLVRQFHSYSNIFILSFCKCVISQPKIAKFQILE